MCFYPVPHLNLMEVFKNKLQHLVEIGVLSKCEALEWAAPTFIIQKQKDGRISWVSDFRELKNLSSARSIHYHQGACGHASQARIPTSTFIIIDISTQYYTFELEERSTNISAYCPQFVWQIQVQLPPDGHQAFS